MKIEAPRIPFSVAVVAVVAIGIAIYVLKRGGLNQAAAGAGAAAVNAAGAATRGAVDAVSTAVGLPSTQETTTDPRVARWVIDNVGYWEASKWAGVPALIEGARMEKGSGQPPPAGSPLAKAFTNAASYDETARLTARYPAPATPNWPEPDYSGAGTWG